MKSFRIVGAGFSGLTLAYYLNKISPTSKITVVDKQAFVGGLLQSEKSDFGIVEKAANALLDSEDLRALTNDLGLELLEAAPKIKRAYILRRGRLRSWPLSFLETLYFIYKIILFKFTPKEDLLPSNKISLRDWGAKFLGKKAATYLLDPAMGGIYAAPLETLNARLILGRFFLPKIQETPRKKRKLLSVAPRGGMNELVQKLKEHLEARGVAFELSKEESGGSSTGEVTVYCGSLKDAQVFFKSIVKHLDFFKLRMLSITSTTVFYKAPLPQRAFGLLYPRVEQRPFLGTLLNACVFPSRYTQHSETWIREGVRAELGTLKDIEQERVLLFGRRDKPLQSFVAAWDAALPLYNNDLESFLRESWPSMKEELKAKQIYVHGNYLGKLGLSQLLISSKELANELAGA